jgi:hypothetical protein
VTFFIPAAGIMEEMRMYRRVFRNLPILLLATISGGARAADGEAEYRVSGPLVSENLAVYFVHGKSSPRPAPLTLQEALAKAAVRVYETGNVNELAVENHGEEPVFVQAGDIVKGGKQDRSLTVSLVLPPHSERIPIASFCVEPGRWSQRGREDVHQFSSAAAAMPSREAKLAMKAPAPAQNAAQRNLASDPLHRPAAETQARQQRVWDYVASINRELSSNLSRSGGPMPAPNSLQTALEDDKLKTAQQAYIDQLRPAGEKDPDTIGYVFAVNGRLNSGDVYSSDALFRKMWPKLLAASATEAIASRGAAAAAAPSAEAVRAFVNAAEGGRASVTDLTQHARLETRETEEALYFATAWADGRWVHRNYLAK